MGAEDEGECQEIKQGQQDGGSALDAYQPQSGNLEIGPQAPEGGAEDAGGPQPENVWQRERQEAAEAREAWNRDEAEEANGTGDNAGSPPRQPLPIAEEPGSVRRRSRDRGDRSRDRDRRSRDRDRERERDRDRRPRSRSRPLRRRGMRRNNREQLGRGGGFWRGGSRRRSPLGRRSRSWSRGRRWSEERGRKSPRRGRRGKGRGKDRSRDRDRSRERGGKGGKRRPGGGAIGPQPGEWTCPKCFWRNMPHNEECHRCGFEKPEEAGNYGGYEFYGSSGPNPYNEATATALLGPPPPPPPSWPGGSEVSGTRRDYAEEKPEAYRAFLQHVRQGVDGPEVILSDKMCLDHHVGDLLLCLESWLSRYYGETQTTGQLWRLGKLDLARNNLADENIARVVTWLKEKDIRVLRLDMDSNAGSTQGMSALLDYIWNSTETMLELGLADNEIKVRSTDDDDPVSALLRCLYNHASYPQKRQSDAGKPEDGGIQTFPLTIRLGGNFISGGNQLLRETRDKGGTNRVAFCTSAEPYTSSGDEYLAVYLPGFEEQHAVGKGGGARPALPTAAPPGGGTSLPAAAAPSAAPIAPSPSERSDSSYSSDDEDDEENDEEEEEAGEEEKDRDGAAAEPAKSAPAKAAPAKAAPAEEQRLARARKEVQPVVKSESEPEEAAPDVPDPRREQPGCVPTKSATKAKAKAAGRGRGVPTRARTRTPPNQRSPTPSPPRRPPREARPGHALQKPEKAVRAHSPKRPMLEDRAGPASAPRKRPVVEDRSRPTSAARKRPVVEERRAPSPAPLPPRKRGSLLVKSLEKGHRAEGTVIMVRDNFALVDFGCEIDGLLHVHDLKRQVEKATEILRDGDEVSVEVSRICNRRDRVNLRELGSSQRPARMVRKRVKRPKRVNPEAAAKSVAGAKAVKKIAAVPEPAMAAKEEVSADSEPIAEPKRTERRETPRLEPRKPPREPSEPPRLDPHELRETPRLEPRKLREPSEARGPRDRVPLTRRVPRSRQSPASQAPSYERRIEDVKKDRVPIYRSALKSEIVTKTPIKARPALLRSSTAKVRTSALTASLTAPWRQDKKASTLGQEKQDEALKKPAKKVVLRAAAKKSPAALLRKAAAEATADAAAEARSAPKMADKAVLLRRAAADAAMAAIADGPASSPSKARRSAASPAKDGDRKAIVATGPKPVDPADTFGDTVKASFSPEEKKFLQNDIIQQLAAESYLANNDQETRKELAEFVVCMLEAKKRPSEVKDELDSFMKSNSSGFMSWLKGYLKGPWQKACRVRAIAAPKATAKSRNKKPAAAGAPA